MHGLKLSHVSKKGHWWLLCQLQNICITLWCLSSGFKLLYVTPYNTEQRCGEIYCISIWLVPYHGFTYRYIISSVDVKQIYYISLSFQAIYFINSSAYVISYNGVSVDGCNWVQQVVWSMSCPQATFWESVNTLRVCLSNYGDQMVLIVI